VDAAAQRATLLPSRIQQDGRSCSANCIGARQAWCCRCLVSHPVMYSSTSTAVCPAHGQQPAPALPAMDGAALGAGGLQGLPHQPPVRSAGASQAAIPLGPENPPPTTSCGGLHVSHVARALSAHPRGPALRPLAQGGWLMLVWAASACAGGAAWQATAVSRALVHPCGLHACGASSSSPQQLACLVVWLLPQPVWHHLLSCLCSLLQTAESEAASWRCGRCGGWVGGAVCRCCSAAHHTFPSLPSLCVGHPLQPGVCCSQSLGAGSSYSAWLGDTPQVVCMFCAGARPCLLTGHCSLVEVSLPCSTCLPH
jgi:hypothetical protein